jgi:CubicO group peptidase (beta-lactamase class C family)
MPNAKWLVNAKRMEVLDAFLRKLTEQDVHPSSVVKVLYNGLEIFSGAYGVSRPGGLPLETDAIFPMASVTKPVTATLLAILQEDGEIDFCDRLSRYFPAFSGGMKDQVELWQLLCHSSGMSDELIYPYVDTFIKEELGITLPENPTPEEISRIVTEARKVLGLPEEDSPAAREEAELLLRLKAPLARDPHTGFEYSGFAYGLLGKLVEKVSGETIERFARRRLFEPLGMADSHYLLPRDKWQRVVKRDPSFCFAEGLNSDGELTNTNGAGGLKSTVPDLARFGQMFLQEGAYGNAQILSPASVRLMTTNYNADLPPSSWFGRMLSSAWALGWHVRCGKKDDLGLLRSDNTFDHGGAGGARLVVDPDNGLVISMYLVDKERFESYANHSRVANIVYSALV